MFAAISNSSLLNKIGLTVTRRLNSAVTTLLGSLASRLGLNVGYQHVLLGQIAFDLILYFEGSDESFGGEYVEHGLIGGKPRLQVTGDKLTEIKWQIVLHAAYCDVETEVLKLRQACAAHEAMPLVYANGDYRGLFIPVDATVSSRQTTRDGTLIWVEATLNLKEYAAPPALAEQPPTQPAKAAEKNGKKPVKSGTHANKKRSGSKPAVRGGKKGAR